jgi:hypothetical protein
MDLSELLSDAKRRGFTHDFAMDLRRGAPSARRTRPDASEARIVEANAVDAGTDPGDDATVYLIETPSGLRGYLVLSDSFHADPRKAAFLDQLKRRANAGGG